MRHLVMILMAAAFAGGCSTYSGIWKKDSEVYLTGATSYVVLTKNWVKRCSESGNQLTCVELAVSDVEGSGPRINADGSAARCPPWAPDCGSAPAVPRD
jgi:hypothetical protein